MDEKKIEEKIEEISRAVEQKLTEFGDKLEGKIHDKKSKDAKRKGGDFAGIVLIVIGFIFLANNLNWFRWDIPLIPLLLIILGVYLIYSHRDRT